MNICVFAGTFSGINPAFEASARALGREIAIRGHTLIFGGGAVGIMGAAAQSVRNNGGKVICIAPRFFDTPGTLFPGCTETILTGTIRERKQLMEDCSDAFAALPGGLGTFEEFFEIITLRQLGRHEKPAALLNAGGYYTALDALVNTASAGGFLKKPKDCIYSMFDDAESLLDYFEAQVR